MRHFRPSRLNLLFAMVCATLLLTSCGEKTFPVRTYGMGERVDLGHLVYTVFEVQWLTHIGEGPDARVPQHRFFLVRLSAVNGGPTEMLVPGLTLEDDAGNHYSEIDNGEGVPQWIKYLRSVRPADSVAGHVVFDAPPKHYKLRITDETGEKTALIDIPLSFGAETPETLTPTKQ
jgi:hypothetical protein